MVKAKHAQVDIHKSHPTLYLWIVTFAVGRVALGVGYWISRPTFTPYGIHRYIAGVVFFLLGLSQLVFLHVWRDLRKIRAVMVSSGFVAFVWGVVNLQQVVRGKASLAFPVAFITIAVLQFVTASEPAINPVTERK